MPYGNGKYCRVILNGAAVHLGIYGTHAAQAAYDAAIARHLESGRTWPSATTMVHTVAHVGRAFVAWANTYYRKGDRATSSTHIAARAVELLAWAGLDAMPADGFRPSHLREFQRYLLEDEHRRWSRKTINEYTRCIVDAFRLAAEHGAVPADRWQALRAVRMLARGRSPFAGVQPPRDGQEVLPVPQADLEVTLRHVSPTIAAMIKLQLATAMRPGEVVKLRPRYIAPTKAKGVFCYHVPPDANKTAHHEIERVVFLGPKAMAVLTPMLPTDPDAFVFSPRAAVDAHHAQRTIARRTPRQPSHDLAARRAARERSRRQPALAGDHYTTDSYRRAIARACERAKVTPWSPHQLRHNAASFIANAESLEVARIILGHSSIETTLIYVQPDRRKAERAALRHG